MSRLRRLLRDYLELRRGLGFKLERPGLLLPDFVAYLERHRAAHITTALAEAWAKQPADGHPAWWSQRLSMVREFARHLQALDAETQIPPRDLLPSQTRRATPYVYSEGDIARIVAAARTELSPFRGQTCSTLFGLLAVTGMRVGEAIALDRDDVDLVGGVLIVRDSKFGKSRELPIHQTVVSALARYAKTRDAEVRCPQSPAFFLASTGTRPIYQNVHFVFRGLVRALGLRPRSQTCRPRIHDLRHTFAVRTLIGWYRADVDVATHLPRLSTYLGHVDPITTYWYLSATPELLELASRRLEHVNRRRS